MLHSRLMSSIWFLVDVSMTLILRPLGRCHQQQFDTMMVPVVDASVLRVCFHVHVCSVTQHCVDTKP